MILSIPLFSKALFRNHLKRFSWGSVLYFILLFLSTSMLFFLKTPEEWTMQSSGYGPGFSLLLSRYNVFPTLLAIAVPTVTASLLFRSLHSEKQTCFFHSLPLTRGCIYRTSLLSGWILMLVPVALNGIVLLAVSALGGYGQVFSASDVLIFAGLHAWILFVLYSITVFVAMLTGNTVAHLALTYIFNLLPALFTGTVSYILAEALFGFTIENPYTQRIMEYTPLLRFLSMLEGEQATPQIIVIFLCFGILFYILGYVGYRARKNEMAGDVIAFPILKPVLKYLMSFLSCLCAYFVLKKVSQGNSLAIAMWMALISGIIYFSCEMLFQKSLRVSGSFKGYLGFAGAVVAMALMLSFDVLGFETYVPKADQVISVAYSRQFSLENRKDLLMTDQDAIETIVKIHENIIRDRNKIDNQSHYPLEYRQISYTMRSGRTVNRFYQFSTEGFQELFDRLYESREFKEKEFSGIFQCNIDQASLAVVTNGVDSQRTVTVTGKKEIQALYESLKADCYAISYTDYQKENWIANAAVSFMNDSGSILRANVNVYYKNVMAYLQEKDIYRSVFPGSKQIRSLALSWEIMNNSDSDALVMNQNNMEFKKMIEIKSPRDIDEILDLVYSGNLIRNRTMLQRFRILFFGDTGYMAAYIDPDNIPPVIQKYIKLSGR